MKAFVGNQFGRYVIIGLQRDDLVLESIQKVIDDNGIRNAIVTSGIGATYHMRWHHIKNTDERPTDVIYETDGPMEVSSIGGLVIEGRPHLHCAFANHERSWVGHLEEGCRIQYVGEISLIEVLDVDLARVADEFGVKHLEKR